MRNKMYPLLILTVLSVILDLCFMSVSNEHNVYSIPLRRQKSPLKMLINDPYYRDKLNIKKHSPKNENVTLYKYLDSEYYAEILVGKPGKKFTVIFDTTWGDMWLPSKLCSPFVYPICGKKNLYNDNGSSTHKSIDPKPFNVSGLVGNLTCDTVRLAHLNVTDLVFAEIREIPNILDYQLMKADGIIGLGYKDIAQTTNNPFFYKLLGDNKILKPIFSLYLNRDVTTSKGGTIFFGGFNEKHMNSSFSYAQVTQRGYWQIEMNQFSVQLNKTNVKTFCTQPCQVILDSGNNQIGVPREYVTTINNLIGAKEYFFDRYEVSCLKVQIMPTITLNIGGKDFHISGRHYVQKIENGTSLVCLSAFRCTEADGGLWTLGGAFLSSVYTTFDVEKNRVGFANLK